MDENGLGDPVFTVRAGRQRADSYSGVIRRSTREVVCVVREMFWTYDLGYDLGIIGHDLGIIIGHMFQHHFIERVKGKQTRGTRAEARAQGIDAPDPQMFIILDT